MLKRISLFYRDRKKLIDGLAILLICSIPVLLLIKFKSSAYHGDIATFQRWYVALADKHLAYTYLSSGCNYPIIGCLISHKTFGMAELVNKTYGVDTFLAYRYVLAIFDILNIVFVYKILRILVRNHAILCTLIITIIPSTRTNGSLWGQLDGVLLLFALIPIYLCLMINRLLNTTTAGATQSKIVIYYALSLIAVILGVSSKQLFIFSTPALLLMCFYIWIRIYKKLRATGVVILISSIVIMSIAVLIDTNIPLLVNFKSHMAFIFAPSNSYHGKEITRNGFNIWVFVSQTARKVESSQPYLKYAYWSFITYCGLMGVVLVNLLFYKHRTEQFKLNMFIFCIGLFNLAFNVLMVGTHERYLYLGYPLILIALFSLRMNKIIKFIVVAITIIMACYYGMFVATFLAGISIPSVRTADSIYALSIFHAILLLILTVIYTLTCRTWRINETTSARKKRL